jgi:hypothetical protein
MLHEYSWTWCDCIKMMGLYNYYSAPCMIKWDAAKKIVNKKWLCLTRTLCYKQQQSTVHTVKQKQPKTIAKTH